MPPEFPATTTMRRIWRFNPCPQGQALLRRHFSPLRVNDDPVLFTTLVDTCGLNNTIWAAQTRPDLGHLWRRYALFCARHVAHHVKHPTALAAMARTEEHLRGTVTRQQLAASWGDCERAIWDLSLRHSLGQASGAEHQAAMAALHCSHPNPAMAASWAAACSSSSLEVAQLQVATFRQLVSTGEINA